MPEWVFQLVGIFAAAAGVYAGIRADIRGIHEGVKHAKESADEAHKRIDLILIKGQ